MNFDIEAQLTILSKLYTHDLTRSDFNKSILTSDKALPDLLRSYRQSD